MSVGPTQEDRRLVRELKAELAERQAGERQWHETYLEANAENKTLRAELAEAKSDLAVAASDSRDHDQEVATLEAALAETQQALRHIPQCGKCASGRYHSCPIYTAALANVPGGKERND